jgi:DtxR family Mn-dependent transcriptional regulator
MEVWKRFNEKEGHSMAHYLMAVAALSQNGGASVSAIAERLGVSKAGVTSMLRTLKSRGLVDHERYGDVQLTKVGQKLAARTERSRDVLTRFFVETLGVEPSAAEEDACMIEHLVSVSSMVELLRMTAFLASNDPAAERFRTAFRDYRATAAPGRPGDGCRVPRGASGTRSRMSRPRWTRPRPLWAREVPRGSLDRIVSGSRAVVHGIEAEDSFTRSLLELGLVPGTVIEVVRRAPLGDPIELWCPARTSIRRQEARRILVKAL